MNYCTKKPMKCLVHFCKECEPDNNYFCSKCLTSEYEINKITGSCVKKTEVEPAITWKDIYRLSMNGKLDINGKIMRGPCFLMRGITCSQISSKHAFIISVQFLIKNRIRNLEEEPLEVPTICQIDETVEESKDRINIVDYECIGTFQVDSKYKMVGVIGDNIDKNIINNPEKNYSSYIEVPTLFIFENNDLVNKNFTTRLIDFSFKGNLKGDKANQLPNSSETQIEIYELNETAKCNFLKDEKLNASLTCKLQLKDNQESTNITFKNPEIEIGDKTLFLGQINKVYFNYIKSDLGIKIRSPNDNNTTLIIVLSVVFGVIGLGGIVAVVIYFVRKNNKKVNKQDGNIKNMNDQSISGNNEYNASSANINN